MVGEKCCILYEIVRPNKDPSKRTSYSNIVLSLQQNKRCASWSLYWCIYVYIHNHYIYMYMRDHACILLLAFMSTIVHGGVLQLKISPALGRNHWSCWTIRATKKQLRYSELVSALTDASLEVPVGSGGPQLSTQRNSNESMRYTASKVVGLNFLLHSTIWSCSLSWMPALHILNVKSIPISAYPAAPAALRFAHVGDSSPWPARPFGSVLGVQPWQSTYCW